MFKRAHQALAPLTLLIALLISACSNQPPAPTAVATTGAAAPTAAPTVAPTEALAAPTAVPTVAPTAAPAAGFGAAWAPEPCASFAVAEALAARSDCGYVTVPERHAGGERTIELAVVRVRATADQPGAPLVVGTGGPGGQGFLLTSAQTYALGIQIPSLWGGILAEHDVVFFSQRGTRYARPDLVCPAFDAANYEAALNRLSPEERVATARAGLQACADAFTARGVDFAAYNSDENAADIASIAETLGYSKIFYYGQSYGTILGQFLIRNHPAILEGIILDGIMPVTFSTYEQQVDIVRSFRTTFEACAANAACNTAYPDLEAVLSEVYAQLQANPQTVAVDSGDGQKAEVIVTGFSIIDGLLGKAYGSPTALPKAIYDLKGLDPAVVATYAPQLPGVPATSVVMHFTVNCGDDPSTALEDVDLQAVPELYREFVTDDLAKAVDGCAVVKVPQLPAASDALARSDVPALLLSGALDPATLAPLSTIVAGGLPNSYAVVFPDSGHVQSQNQCAVTIMAAFVNDPGTAPNTSCVDPRHVVFPLPIAQRVTALSPDERAAFSLDLPPGFVHLTVPLTPYAYVNGPFNLALSAFPAGTTADQALAQVRAQLDATVGTPEGLESGAGPEVAGLPSQFIRYSTLKVAAVDLIAFADERGTYLVTAVVASPDLVQPFREEILPALFASVEVGK